MRDQPDFTLLEKVKMGKHLLSHRYNLLPLLRSRPGGVQRELIVKDLPTANVRKEIRLGKIFFKICPYFTEQSSNQLEYSALQRKLFYLRLIARI